MPTPVSRYWWELALLLRRLSVSVVLVFLGEYPGYQGALAVLILLACFGMETKAEPFKFRNTFLLDAMAIGCLIVYLVCNMVRLSPLIPRSAGADARAERHSVAALSSTRQTPNLTLVAGGKPEAKMLSHALHAGGVGVKTGGR